MEGFDSTLPPAGTVATYYARVSTQIQEEQKTIRSQIVRHEKFIKEHNWRINQEYVDDGYSGSILERPALDRLRNDAKLHKFDAIIVTEPDRLSRSFPYLLYLEKEFAKLGIPVIYLSRPTIAKTPFEIAFVRMQGVWADMERGIFLDRTRRGKIQKARDGILITSIPPYGYKYIRKSEGGPKYIVDEDEAEKVILIFKLFIEEAMSINGVTRELTNRGLKARSGREFGKTTIARILSNQIYIGIPYFNRHKRVETTKQQKSKYRRVMKTSLKLRPKHEWIKIPTEVPSIIDRRTFEKVQQLLKQRRKFFKRAPKHKYLLSGLLFCGRCNSRFLSTPFHNVPYYRCGGTRKYISSGQMCSASSVKARVLDGAVGRGVLNLLNRPTLIMNYLKEIRENKEGEVLKIQEKVTQKKLKIQENNKKLGKLYDLYAENNLEKEVLYNKIEELNNNKQNLIKDIEFLQESIATSNAIPNDFIISEQFIEECMKKIRQNYCNLSFQNKKKTMNMFIDRVVYNDKKAYIKGNIPIFEHKGSWLLDQSSEHCDYRQRLFRGRALHDVDL